MNEKSFLVGTFSAGLRANGVTPMKDGLLMALKEIVTNGETQILTNVRNPLGGFLLSFQIINPNLT